MAEATTDRLRKATRQWVRAGQRLRIEIDVEVLSIGADKKANLRVIGNPTAICVDSPDSDSDCNSGDS